MSSWMTTDALTTNTSYHVLIKRFCPTAGPCTIEAYINDSPTFYGSIAGLSISLKTPQPSSRRIAFEATDANLTVTNFEYRLTGEGHCSSSGKFLVGPERGRVETTQFSWTPVAFPSKV